MRTAPVTETACPTDRGITLLYHSGPGGTRLVAELLGEILSAQCRARVMSIHDPGSAAAVDGSDLLVFCFPTYYLRPSPSMAQFIESLPRFHSPRTAYIVATYELYTENCVRVGALRLKGRGLRVAGSKVIRAPGADVTCLIPAWLCPWLYRFQRGFHRRLLAIAREITGLARAGHPRERIPAWKLYTPFAQLLQVLFLNRLDGWRDRIRILGERCVDCDACVACCDRKAWVRENDRLRHVPERCELCTRCIHQCPRKAIVLVRALRDSPRLDRRLYRELKDEARQRLREAGVRLDSAEGRERRHRERKAV